MKSLFTFIGNVFMKRSVNPQGEITSTNSMYISDTEVEDALQVLLKSQQEVIQDEQKL